MSHFTVIVALRPTAPANVRDALAEALAPFDENRDVTPYYEYVDGKPGEHYSVAASRKDGLLPEDEEPTWAQVADAYNTRYNHDADDSERMHVDAGGRAYTISQYNPHSKWDWWEIGGRWTGYFPTRPEHTGDPRLITGRPGVFGNRAEVGHVDGGPKALLDFGLLRNAKAVKAGDEYDRWTALVEGLPVALPWSHFVDRIDADPDYTIDDARRDYRVQERAEKARESEDFRWHDDAIGQFSVSREEYVQRAADQAVPGYAFLGLDGVWTAPGRMGWFGMSSGSEEDRAAYYRRMNDHLDSLDDSTLLVVVDCHI